MDVSTGILKLTSASLAVAVAAVHWCVGFVLVKVFGGFGFVLEDNAWG